MQNNTTNKNKETMSQEDQEIKREIMNMERKIHRRKAIKSWLDGFKK